MDLSVNNQIISLELSKRLDEYRAFRHFFIHGYGVLLDREKLMPLAESLPDLWKDFEFDIATFMESFNSQLPIPDPPGSRKEPGEPIVD